MKKITKLLVFCLLCLSAFDTLGKKKVDERPNIIVIMADDLGYRDLGSYGCKDIRTPNIDKLAKNGARFTSAYVTGSMCGPSRAGFITGRYQSSFGYYKNPPEPLDPKQGLPENTLTFAKLLQDQGYVTGGVGKWHMGTAPHQHPNVLGYDDWFGFLGGGLYYYPLEHYGDLYLKKRRPWGARVLHHTLPVLHNDEPVKWEGYLTDVLTDAGVNFIEKNKTQPFFLFMSYNAPHYELEAPEETIAKYPPESMTLVPKVKPKDRSIYGAMVEELDKGVGELMATLEKNDLAENTIVWFLSDHGGMKISDNRPLKGNKGSFHEGGIRIPLIAHWPKEIKKGIVLNQLVSTLDISATSVSMAGGAINEEQLHGEDIQDYITSKSNKTSREAIYWRTKPLGMKAGVVREGDFKLVIDGKTLKLFNLKNDLTEMVNISDSHPELVQRLLSQWEDWDKISVKGIVFSHNAKQKYQFGNYEWLKGNINYKAKTK